MKKNRENKFFYAIKYGKPTNILLQIFRLKLRDVTQLNPMMVIFAIYITVVLWEAKLTSQVLYNENTHHGLGEERGYFHIIREENKKKGEMAYPHFQSRQESSLPDFLFISFL